MPVKMRGNKKKFTGVRKGKPDHCRFFPGQLAFCKKAVVGLTARRIF